MEKAKNINPLRIEWCCNEQNLSLQALAQKISISLSTLTNMMRGEDTLSINQLRKIATYFNRGILFFLEPGPVNETTVHTAQFRTITNQKPELSPKVMALVERMEKQRQIFISLQEDLGENISRNWFPSKLTLDHKNIKNTASEVRKWLNLGNVNDFDKLRRSVESKAILVFISNSYKGSWQIAKESSIRGFSLYYPTYPIIAIKKQSANGPQAFTLMHELAHLLLHRESTIDEEKDFYNYQGKEKVANEFAGNVLVPDSFLHLVDIVNFPMDEVSAYDLYLESHCKSWCVSGEVILRRLLNEGILTTERYQAYRKWKESLPLPKPTQGGIRYRYKEPIRIFGEPFVHTVLDALNNRQITLARASTYLDNLKISDLHQLEAKRVHI